MITLSLCMIVKDEEKVLKRCLDSVSEVIDEIIIVDTGSKDKTKDIARLYTDKVYDYSWEDDFSKARNYSFTLATKEYILWLDADEYLTVENKDKLLKLKEALSKDTDSVTAKTYICLNDNNPKVICTRNRIVKREKNYSWLGFVHEYLEVSGNIYNSDINIIHNKIRCSDDRNLKIYKSNIDKGITLSIRDTYYFAKELYCNSYYNEAIEMFKKHLNKATHLEEKTDDLYKISKCYFQLKDYESCRKYLFDIFELSVPSGEALYSLAESYEKELKYEQAIYWYEVLLMMGIPTDCNQCLNIECLRFRPHLNLCICYFEVNNLQKAYYHHMKCMEINPHNKCVISNDKFFKSIIKKE